MDAAEELQPPSSTLFQQLLFSLPADQRAQVLGGASSGSPPPAAPLVGFEPAGAPLLIPPPLPPPPEPRGALPLDSSIGGGGLFQQRPRLASAYNFGGGSSFDMGDGMGAMRAGGLSFGLSPHLGAAAWSSAAAAAAVQGQQGSFALPPALASHAGVDVAIGAIPAAPGNAMRLPSMSLDFGALPPRTSNDFGAMQPSLLLPPSTSLAAAASGAAGASAPSLHKQHLHRSARIPGLFGAPSLREVPQPLRVQRSPRSLELLAPRARELRFRLALRACRLPPRQRAHARRDAT